MMCSPLRASPRDSHIFTTSGHYTQSSWQSLEKDFPLDFTCMHPNTSSDERATRPNTL
jgi:hypothetical protein